MARVAADQPMSGAVVLPQVRQVFRRERPTPRMPSRNWSGSSRERSSWGARKNEAGRRDNEGPQTPVTLSRGFWIGKYEVTLAQYQGIVGTGSGIGIPGDLNHTGDEYAGSKA